MQAGSISKAGLHDITDLLPLVNSAYRGEEAKKGWTHEADLIEGFSRTDAASLEQLISGPHGIILTYRDAEKILGCVYLEKQNTALYLGMLSVSPEAQAQGIGKKLLQASESYALEQNCSSIEMTVISVRHELIAWYERNGYEKTDQVKPFHNDGRFGIPRQHIQFVVMEKHLAPSW